MKDKYKLSIGQTVYLLFPPTKFESYRYIKGTICKFINKHSYSTKDSIKEISYDKESIPKLKAKYKIKITNVDDMNKYYLAPLDRIYLLDELEELRLDIENLIKLRAYKEQLEQNYRTYIKNELGDWNTRYQPVF